MKKMVPMVTMMPMEKVIPMTPMAPMNHHLHQWIANVSIGAIDANDVIDAIAIIGDHRRHIITKRRQWSHFV